MLKMGSDWNTYARIVGNFGVIRWWLIGVIVQVAVPAILSQDRLYRVWQAQRHEPGRFDPSRGYYVKQLNFYRRTIL